MNPEYITIGDKSIDKEVFLNKALNLFYQTGEPISISIISRSFGIRQRLLGGSTRDKIRELLETNHVPVKTYKKKRVNVNHSKVIWSRSSDDAKAAKPQTDPSFAAILATCNEAAKHDVILARRIMETFLSLPQTV